MLRSNRPGRTRAGSRSDAAVGRADDQDVGRRGGRARQAPVVGEPGVHGIDEGALQADRARRLLEGLELHEQLVDHSGHALPVTGSGPAHAADGVELFDEADRAAFLAGVLSQLLEEGPDLAVGLTVEHGLERGRRDEEERHARLGGHRLGHVGLAGARRALEEDRLAGDAAHLLGEGAVCEEEVECLRDLVDQGLRATDVVEADGQIVGPVEDVWRPPGRRHRDDHHQREQEDEGQRRQHRLEGRRHVGHGQRRGRIEEVAEDEHGRDEGEQDREPSEPAAALPFAMCPDIGAREAGHPVAAQLGEHPVAVADRRLRRSRRRSRVGEASAALSVGSHVVALHWLPSSSVHSLSGRGADRRAERPAIGRAFLTVETILSYPMAERLVGRNLRRAKVHVNAGSR